MSAFGHQPKIQFGKFDTSEISCDIKYCKYCLLVEKAFRFNKRFNIVLEIFLWIDNYEQIDLLLVAEHWQNLEDVVCFLNYVLKASVESL